MEGRAEINRFAIFLFCLLVPFGSLAPTETSESRLTTRQRHKDFTTNVQSLTSVILQKAQELFEFYQTCTFGTFDPEPWTFQSEATDLVQSIPKCPAFQENCCALHRIRDVLKTLKGDIETICKDDPKLVVDSNLEQLHITVSEGTTFYNCSTEHLPQVYPQGLADKKNYIWWVLKRYEDIMQMTDKLYS